MRKFFTKKRNIIVMATLFIAATLIFVVYNTYPKIHGKLYSGNHIKLDLSISYEGKQLDGDDFKIACINPEGEMETISKDGKLYAVKGGEYGKYNFVVTLASEKIGSENIEDDLVIELQFINSNDWYISKSNCVIEIDDIDGVLNCKYKVITEYNDGTSSDYSEERLIEDDKVEFSWGL